MNNILHKKPYHYIESMEQSQNTAVL